MKDQFVPSYLSTNGTFGSVSSDEWKSYLPMPNYPEYPSATTAICYAHAEAMRRLLGSDYLKWSIEMSKFEFSRQKIEGKNRQFWIMYLCGQIKYYFWRGKLKVKNW